MPAKLIDKNIDKKIKAALSKAPRALGSIAVSFFKQSFIKQGFTDESLKSWQPRTNGKDSGRAILVKSGRLRNSIRVIRADTSVIIIGTDVPYAKIHNRGYVGGVTVKAHHRTKTSKVLVYNIISKRGRTVKTDTGRSQIQSFTRRIRMPKRQFMGNSAQLNKLITQWFVIQLKNQ